MKDKVSLQQFEMLGSAEVTANVAAWRQAGLSSSRRHNGHWSAKLPQQTSLMTPASQCDSTEQDPAM